MSEWTAVEDATLHTLWHQSPVLSAAEIGRQIGKTKNSVVGRARRLNLAGRQSTIVRTGPHVPQQPRKLKPKAPTLAALSSVSAVIVAPPPPPKLVVRVKTERCAFPLSDGRLWRFCEAMAEYGSPYCTKHHRICYVRHPWSAAA